MRIALLLIHIAFAIALVGLVLIQSSKGGLGGGLGAGEFYRSRRGAERVVFLGTIVFAVLFFLTSIGNLIVR